MPIYTPYTYLIGWSSQDLWYYGTEFGCKTKTAHPSNLWVTYFTSSRFVKETITKHGDPDVVEIRRTFTTSKDALCWENKVLRRIDAKSRSKWLNQHNGDGNFRLMGHTLDTAKRISESTMGRVVSQETRLKQSKVRSGRKLNVNHVANVVNAVSRNWIVTHPTGEIEHVKNLNQFCITHGLHIGLMSIVAAGKRNHHRGFKCQRA